MRKIRLRIISYIISGIVLTCSIFTVGNTLEPLTVFASEETQLPDTAWYYQAGEDASTYSISTAEELRGLASLVHDGNGFKGKTIELANDIDLNKEDFSPIGDNNFPFQGTFDGKNHIIRGLKQSRSEQTANTQYIGLFGRPTGTVNWDENTPVIIQNLTVEDFDISVMASATNKNNVQGGIGTIVGYGQNVQILNCIVKNGTVQTNYGCSGGIAGQIKSGCVCKCDGYNINVTNTNTGGGRVGLAVGFMNASSSPALSAYISDVSVSGNVTGIGNIGGICGHYYDAYHTADETGIINCTVEKETVINGDSVGFTGGICGSCGRNVINCINYGTVNGNDGNNVSGIATLNYFSEGSLTIEKCVNRGKVTGASYVNGIAGGNKTYSSGLHPLYINNCANFGDVESKDAIVDGFARISDSYEVNISNSFNLGRVTDNDGNNVSPAVLDNYTYNGSCYLDLNATEETAAAQPAGLSEKQFKDRTAVDILNGEDAPVWFQNVDYPDFAGNMTPVEEITVDKTAEVGIDKEVDIKAVLTPDDATNKGLIFTSSDEEIATVTADGKVSGKKVGEADITVMALYDGSKAVCKVTVKDLDKEAAQKVIDEIKAIDPSKATLEELEAIQKKYDALTPEQKAIVDADADASAAKKVIDAKVEELEKAKKDDQQTTVAVKTGTKFTVKGYKYMVTSNFKKNPTVKITGYKNKKLKKIAVPATVTYNKVAFKVTEIGKGAFKNQKKATSAVIGKNVDTISASAFAGDAKLKKITVKSAVVKKVGAKALKGINKKAVIKVPSKNLKAYKKLFKGKGQKKTVKIKK